MTDLVAWLPACYDRAEQKARAVTSDGEQSFVDASPAIEPLLFNADGEFDLHKRMLADIARKRLILAEHLPQWQIVEWDHDQNGKGEALCCPRCQNAEHSEWNPPCGHAVGLPEGFVTPYVLAPCRTVRLLAEEFAGEPGYDERWRP